MNKYLYILGLAGAALFSACSNSEDLSIGESPTIDEVKESALIYEASQNSEVPITLGISRGYTRKPLDPSDASGNFETPDGKYFGVFCLATGTQSGVDVSKIPSAIREYRWYTTDTENLIVRLKNVPAKVRKVGTTSDVIFVDPDNTSNEKYYYYPMTNWMKYNFYAYYPRQGDGTLSFSKNQVLQTNYEIDGSQDLIWGMSDQVNLASVAADPYCANYFRLAKEAAGGGDISTYYPKFTFKHKFVQFRFFVKAADASLATLTGLNAQVTDMYIANVYSNLTLVVANKLDPEYNGTLSKFNSLTKNLRIKKNDSDVNRFDQVSPFGDENLDNPLAINVSTVDVTSDTPVGYIMLPRPEVFKVTNYKYQLVVKLEYTGGSNMVAIDMDPPTGGFVEGMTYNIVINIKSSDLE